MCPRCESKKVQNRGSRRGVKRYFCTNCNHSFSSKRRPQNLQKIIFKEYFYNRQTLANLSAKYNRSVPWIRKQIYEYQPVEKVHNPRAVNLICDATFYGKRSDKLGTLVFKDSLSRKILIWKHIQNEKLEDYAYLLDELLCIGYRINSITIDGKRGLFRLFDRYKIQMCQFHQRQILMRYLTKNPKLKASIELNKIMKSLTTDSEKTFTYKLEKWYQTHHEFLNEKTLNFDTGKRRFAHSKLRSAYRSLDTNLPYLFTYKNYPNLQINNTTNSLDGGVFSPMKKLLNIHSGMSKSLKLKLVDDFLVHYPK